VKRFPRIPTTRWAAPTPFTGGHGARRGLTPGGPDGQPELAYGLCHGPAHTTIDRLVRIVSATRTLEHVHA
jgi:hypothetical protein